MARPDRRLIRAAFLLASAVLAAAILAAATVWVSAGRASVPVWLTVLGAILGVIWAATGIAANARGLREGRQETRRKDLLRPVLIESDPFVDRLGEMDQLSRALVVARCVNLHGQRGAGKSHLLGFVADLINGHRERAERQPPSGFSASLYFDMADAAGFEEFVDDVRRSTYPDAASWSDFVGRIDREFGSQRLLLVVDNANLRSIWPPLGRAMYEYLARRPGDCVVIGSVDPVVLYNLAPEYIPVRSFDLDAVRDLALHQRPDLTAEQVADLYHQSGGLAMYLRLLLANDRDDRREDAVESFLRFQVLPDLEDTTRSTVATVALLSNVDRAPTTTQLETLGIAGIDRSLQRAAQRSLLAVTADGRIRMHDLVRDSLIRQLPNETDQAAKRLATGLLHMGRPVQASIVALHGDPDGLGIDLAALHSETIETAVAQRNYPVLETISAGYARSDRLANFAARKPLRRALVVYARATCLAGAGDYREAEDVLLAFTPLARLDERLPDELRFDLRFLLADTVHLQNRYDEALEVFHELRSDSEARGDTRRAARCRWAIGHSTRHQGVSLSEALADLEAAVTGAREASDLGTEVLATADAAAIRVAQAEAGEDLNDRLIDLEDRVLAQGERPADLVKLRKERVRVSWALGRTDEAFRLLEIAIDDATSLNDRLLYNLYFEKGELARLSGQLGLARTNYERVAAFSEGNQDRNMIANAIIGLALCDLIDSEGSARRPSEIRAALLRAEDLARNATLYGTASQAQQVLGLVDRGGAEELRQMRVIVF